ncbi:Uma2 family endonuclease [Streptomyces sp. UNOC14_S4]|uniref:Uma2 family endonuclease n=1 Tax=Streptomyces sp. UNOC14_S4 TaxID=2872340 RepID=UPI001E55226F|nr:Uma2 family endonuclease [Streptomyces sp. UNOC14_S4]MCC3770726.1 Uma2 family endonuclease [Streptomyces sp. UNOC14_S4]
MTADAVDPRAYARARTIAEELRPIVERVPGAWAVEIGAAGVVVMMSLVKRHEAITTRVVRQLNAQLVGTHPGQEIVAQSGAEVEHPAVGRMRRPDAVVVPLPVLDEPGATVDPDDLLAVVEVVSESNPDNDYVEKAADYPAMGIPLYLLVDPRKGLVYTYADPVPGSNGPRYASVLPYVFGDRVPFGPWTVDTADFKRYDDA